MITTTEMEIKVSNGRIVNAKVDSAGICKLTVELDFEQENNQKDESIRKTKFKSKKVRRNEFVLIEASKLKLDDEILKHEPISKEEDAFRRDLIWAIKKGVKDFYRPVFDPSLNGIDEIWYVSDQAPAVDKDYSWWVKHSILVNPDRRSRLGSPEEYFVFLGALIKKLILSGWTTEEAWHAVCNDSVNLGNYWNTENDAIREYSKTGTYEVCGFCDLANTRKILLSSSEYRKFYIASGSFYNHSSDYPLAKIVDDSEDYYAYNNATGWIVLEK